MTPAEIVQIVIGGLSLLATIAVSFLIYWLQHNHEKEQEKLEEQRESDRRAFEEQRLKDRAEQEKRERQKQLSEQAELFLMDNVDERDYLPWCIIAANQHRLKKHSRKIYSEFCRCSKELQAEILSKAGITYQPIVKTNWVNAGIDQLRDDIKKYKLAIAGNDYLYDGAKYFHRGFEYYRELEYQFDEQYVFQTIWLNEIIVRLTGQNAITASSYIEQYFDFILGNIPDDKLANKNPLPPINYIWDKFGLGYAAEEKVCYYVMLYVREILLNIHCRFSNREDSLYFENLTDAQVELYEDMYYDALLLLYNVYGLDRKNGKMI